MPDLEFTLVDAKEWEKLPVPQPKKSKDRYEEVLNVLESYKIVMLQAENENDLKGMRIAIGRKSRARGFVTEFRNDGTKLYVKRSDREVQPPKPKKEKQLDERSASSH